jgi:hypothetical protein
VSDEQDGSGRKNNNKAKERRGEREKQKERMSEEHVRERKKKQMCELCMCCLCGERNEEREKKEREKETAVGQKRCTKQFSKVNQQRQTKHIQHKRQPTNRTTKPVTCSHTCGYLLQFL